MKKSMLPTLMHVSLIVIVGAFLSVTFARGAFAVSPPGASRITNSSAPNNSSTTPAVVTQKPLNKTQKKIIAIMRKGIKSFRGNKFHKAAYYFKEALNLNPANPSILNLLGVSEFKTGNKPAAVRDFKEALLSLPKNSPNAKVIKKNLQTVEK
ncbi:MAG: tetratricopeptide repeat protein [bacterium]